MLKERRKRPSAPPANRRRTSRSSRPSEVREAARRWVRRVAEASVVVASLVGLTLLGGWTRSYVTTAAYFAVGQADVRGNRRLSGEEIQRASGLPQGTNIFAVSPAEAERRLEAHPWIASATVRRRLPRKVEIEIVEREAVALLRLGALYLVDSEGNVFLRIEATDAFDLPLVTGLSPERYREDRAGAQSDLAEALGLMRLYEDSGLSRHHPLSEIHIEQDGNLSLYTLEQGTLVRLGAPPFRRKLQRLAALFDELARGDAVADYVYLDSEVQPDRAVVRLRPQ